MKHGVLKTMWRFGKKYIVFFALAELCILILYAVSLILPLNLSRLVDEALLNKNINVFIQVMWSYVGLFLLSSLTNYCYAMIWQTLNNRYVVDVKNTVYENMLHTKARILSDMDTGDYMTRIDHDSDQFIHIIQRNGFHLVNSILLCSAIFIFVLRVDRTIAFLLLVGAVLPILTAKIGARITENISVSVREEQGYLNGKIFEIIKGLREIKISCAQRWADNKVGSSLKKLIRLGNKTRRTDLIVEKVIYLINLSTSILIYWHSIRLVALGNLSIGLFLAVIEYIALMHKKFNWMLRIYMDYKGRKISIRRVQEILEQEKENTNGTELTEGIQTITLKQVSFGYGAEQVLTDISMSLEAGTVYAVAGASGIGKTTLIGLLTGLYEPQSGMIQINTKNMDELSPYSLRNKISVVGQDLVLFDGTILENLTLGLSCSADEVERVCKLVGIDQVIRRLESGYETVVTTQNHLLSGGEIQRLMIARALLKDADVYIFDESTSALDAETESDILQLIKTSLKDKIVLLISHKVSALEISDQVIVLDNKNIEYQGETSCAYKSKAVQSLFG